MNKRQLHAEVARLEGELREAVAYGADLGEQLDKIGQASRGAGTSKQEATLETRGGTCQREHERLVPEGVEFFEVGVLRQPMTLTVSSVLTTTEHADLIAWANHAIAARVADRQRRAAALAAPLITAEEFERNTRRMPRLP